MQAQQVPPDKVRKTWKADVRATPDASKIATEFSGFVPLISLMHPARPDRPRQAFPPPRSCPPPWASLLESTRTPLRSTRPRTAIFHSACGVAAVRPILCPPFTGNKHNCRQSALL